MNDYKLKRSIFTFLQKSVLAGGHCRKMRIFGRGRAVVAIGARRCEIENFGYEIKFFLKFFFSILEGELPFFTLKF